MFILPKINSSNQEFIYQQDNASVHVGFKGEFLRKRTFLFLLPRPESNQKHMGLDGQEN